MIMSIEEIIKLLRRGMLSDSLLQLAADTIEKLESENNSQKAEIERLRDKLDTVKREIVETILLIEEDIKTAKAEAVKEIIERLEAEITISDKHVRRYNDSKDRTYNNSLREALKIIKEMVGKD